MEKSIYYVFNPVSQLCYNKNTTDQEAYMQTFIFHRFRSWGFKSRGPADLSGEGLFSGEDSHLLGGGGERGRERVCVCVGGGECHCKLCLHYRGYFIHGGSALLTQLANKIHLQIPQWELRLCHTMFFWGRRHLQYELQALSRLLLYLDKRQERQRTVLYPLLLVTLIFNCEEQTWKELVKVVKMSESGWSVKEKEHPVCVKGRTSVLSVAYCSQSPPAKGATPRASSPLGLHTLSDFGSEIWHGLDLLRGNANSNA